jgi:hypothetical protein
MDYRGDASVPVAPAVADDIKLQQPATPGVAEPHMPRTTTTADTVEFATPPTAPEPKLFNDMDDADDADKSHCYRHVADLLVPNATGAAHTEHLFLTSAEEPASVAEAEQDPCRRKAMMEEMNSIKDNRT